MIISPIALLKLKKVRESILIAGSLSKIYISLPVTATTFTGFIAYAGSLSPSLIPLLCGVFLLASGSSGLNHYQERETDALMERTRNRPLPGGRVTPAIVLLFSITLLLAGSLLLYLSFHPPVVILGLFNALWYNAIYTNLKRITAFAVIPGAVTGGVPPMIGWVAAGGYWLDPVILVIFIFFVIGQIPHFWLLLLKYGKQYELAGLPSLTTIFSESQIRRVSRAWLFATLAASAMLPLTGLIRNPALLTAYLVTAGIFLAIIIYPFFLRHIKGRQGIQFVALNVFYLMMMVFLASGQLLK
jgi:heme o synthase